MRPLRPRARQQPGQHPCAGSPSIPSTPLHRWGPMSLGLHSARDSVNAVHAVGQGVLRACRGLPRHVNIASLRGLNVWLGMGSCDCRLQDGNDDDTAARTRHGTCDSSARSLFWFRKLRKVPVNLRIPRFLRTAVAAARRRGTHDTHDSVSKGRGVTGAFVGVVRATPQCSTS